ncbi:MAG: monovalent cation/H(+) antiporter subunit G [Spirochaetota bacterium]
MDLLGVIGGLVSIAGAVFLLLAALGLVRMPDVYNRMQAGTKATTLGSILFLAGVGIAYPGWLPRLALLIVFIVFTNPLSSHALIRAAHAAGIPLAAQTVKDDLAARAAAGTATSEGPPVRDMPEIPEESQ